MAIPFGEYPLIIKSVENGVHTLADECLKDAEQCGVLPTFTTEQLDTMTARAIAFGFKLVFPPAKESEVTA